MSKVYPYINKFSGEVQIMTKKQAEELSEDWATPKVVKNNKGETVYRFELAAEFKDKDVVFLSFALDDKAAIEKYFKEKPFQYATVASATAWADKYGVTGFPTHVIIDREGRIRGRKIGGSEKSDDDLRPLIKAAQ